MKYLPILFVFFTLTGCLSQAPETKDPFNLDLEVINQRTPVGWRNNQDYATGYLFSLDSTDVHHGKYAISLEYKTTEGIDFGSWSMMIPQRYEGKKITLSGYIKTENVNGYAGL